MQGAGAGPRLLPIAEHFELQPHVVVGEHCLTTSFFGAKLHHTLALVAVTHSFLIIRSCIRAMPSMRALRCMPSVG